MSPWAKRVLIAAMVGWTLLTGIAGWYATRGGSDAASATTAGATPTAGPRGAATRATTTTLAAGGAPAIPTSASTTISNVTTGGTTVTAGGGAPDTGAAPTPRPAARLDAAPKYAASGGASGGHIQSVNPSGAGPGAPRPTSTAKAVIVLDPGHGRGDPGAVHHLPDGRVDITEAASNLRNAELIRDELENLGYEVYLTRNGEGRGPGGPLPLQFITSDLYARVGLAKAVNADVYLAIHGNGATVPSISGPETWYCGKHAQGAANEQLARLVQQGMMDALHEYGYAPPDRGIKEDADSHHSGGFCQFVVTRETPVPAALLEFLFLSNDEDARVLVDDRAHVLMAKHVAAAIDAFVGGSTHH